MTRSEPVTVTIARTVASGYEEAFEAWAAELTGAAMAFPGFLGAGLLHPGGSGSTWHVVYRFDSADHLGEWEGSAIRARLVARAGHLVESTDVQRVTGLETWFARGGTVPARWKMFLVSTLAILALQIGLAAALGTQLQHWPAVLRPLVIVPPLAALMTWAVMPALARVLGSWLYAASPRPGSASASTRPRGR